jgi:tellurite resistance protein TerC
MWLWLGFCIFVIFALSIDTWFLEKKNIGPSRSLRAALFWTSVWVACALLFNLILWLYFHYTQGSFIAHEKALNFFTGYLIEKSLSIDNLFAFYVIFHQLRIPAMFQQRVFAYGIWSAIVLRLLLILLGSWLIMHFHWILYVMGGFLLLTGVKMLFISHQEKNIYASKLFHVLQKYCRITNEIKSNQFFIKKNHLLYATPLFIALVFVEISDVIFAFDSIPAIFAITTDPFIVWTSNIFAILGLRAMYFLLAGLVARFRLLKYGIALILVFVGLKMLIAPWIAIPVSFALGLIVGILFLFSLVSAWR